MSNVNVLALKDYPHFLLSEFDCPCCQRVKVEPFLIQCLETTRTILGKKVGHEATVEIVSGYRCPAHNASPQVRGNPDSFHLRGMAADEPLVEGADSVYNQTVSHTYTLYP